jgi:hypothetical protein
LTLAKESSMGKLTVVWGTANRLLYLQTAYCGFLSVSLLRGLGLPLRPRMCWGDWRCRSRFLIRA